MATCYTLHTSKTRPSIIILLFKKCSESLRACNKMRYLSCSLVLCRRLLVTTAGGLWRTCHCLPTQTLILWPWSWRSCVLKSFNLETWSYVKEHWVGKCTSSNMAPSPSSHVAVRRLCSTMEHILGVNLTSTFKQLPVRWICM